MKSGVGTIVFVLSFVCYNDHLIIFYKICLELFACRFPSQTKYFSWHEFTRATFPESNLNRVVASYLESFVVKNPNFSKINVQ